MSTRHPVPAGALEKHIAILGKTGSGKSNLANTIAEDLLAQGARVCVIDPTGTWWGLRLMADGDTPSGHPIVIFGGQHADLPIGAAHGSAIARAIGTSSTPPGTRDLAYARYSNSRSMTTCWRLTHSGRGVPRPMRLTGVRLKPSRPGATTCTARTSIPMTAAMRRSA